MSSPEAAAPAAKQRRWPSLTQQIMIGFAAGCLLGWLAPAFAVKTEFLRDIFINLIKSLIAPLVFSSVVAGIAGAEARRRWDAWA